jgi:hypothetical protein
VSEGELLEAVCQARCFSPGVSWDDGVTEGVARIERMIAERQIAIVLAALNPTPERTNDEQG